MIKKIPKETNTFHFHNENPKGKRTGDCTLRAIAAATGKSWDEVLDGVCEIAHKFKLMPGDDKCYGRYLESLGWVKNKQPRKWDNTKYTGAEWCEEITEDYERGFSRATIFADNVIAHIGGHHIVCIKLDEDDKFKVFDTWNSTGGCIGVYWTK